MTENLLQFIWLHRLYNHSRELKTTDGEAVLVLHPGQWNTHAGPDFLEAKIKIGNTLWVGHVEIHIKSSDWNKHQHQSDPNYSKLILHVVYQNDAAINTLNSTSFSTIELKGYIQKGMVKSYDSLMASKSFIACESILETVRDITRRMQMDRMLAERLEDKTEHIAQLLRKYNNNWQEVFYIQLARSFGVHINQDAFEQVALSTPLSLLAKHKNNLMHIEALLLGQAGFLNEYFDEAYPIQLQKEYQYFKKLYHLEAIDTNLWKFLRLRPPGFPTIRLALFSKLIFGATHLFSKITSAVDIKEIERLFQVEVSDYWQTHYTFQEKSLFRIKTPGKSFVHTVIINAIVPTLFIYGKLQGEHKYCEKAISFLRQLPAEKNSIISEWRNLKLNIENAGDTQALLQLKNKYCNAKRCLECAIGYAIMQRA